MQYASASRSKQASQKLPYEEVVKSLSLEGDNGFRGRARRQILRGFVKSMTDSTLDIIITAVFMGIGGILTAIITTYIMDKNSILKKNKKTNEVIIGHYGWKFIFYLFFGCAVFLCSLPLLFINTFDDADYTLYVGFILFWYFLLFPFYIALWGKVIIYNDYDIKFKCLWRRNFIENIDNIESVLNIPQKYILIKFYSGRKIKIPEHYSSYHYLTGDLFGRIPEHKWI